jgi:RNA polymerase sigma-70 factor (ECF subfamily)
MKQLSLQSEFYNKTKTYSTVQTNQRVDSSSILQRVAKGDRTAIKDCIHTYGDVIWSMAKKFTNSTEDAEAVTQEIFLNVWRYAARFEETNFDELLFITIIARRRLRKYSEKSNQSIN